MNVYPFPADFGRYIDEICQRRLDAYERELEEQLYREYFDEPDIMDTEPETQDLFPPGLWCDDMLRPDLDRNSVLLSERETLGEMLMLPDGTVTLVSLEDSPALWEFTWRSGSHGGGRTYVYRYETRAHACKKVYMHRVITGAGEGESVDHINGDTLDNRRCNLRITTPGGNAQNRKKIRSYRKRAPSSHFKGVSWHRGSGKYLARICKDSKQYHLGCFSDPVQAARAYDRAALEMFEVPRTNFDYGEDITSREAC